MRQHNGNHLETAAAESEEDHSQVELERNYFRSVAEARGRWLALLESELKQIRHEQEWQQAYSAISGSTDSTRVDKSMSFLGSSSRKQGWAD